MMEAHRTSAWRGDYEATLGGQPFATYARSTWRGGGVLDVTGRRYELRSNLWATSYTLVDEGGVAVVSAARVGRKEWTVEADSTTHQFRRASMTRMEHELVVQGVTTGSLRRTSTWRGDAVADLPGLPPLVALFALVVVLTSWDMASAAS